MGGRGGGEREEEGRGGGRSSLVLMSFSLLGLIVCNIKLKIIAFCEFLKATLHYYKFHTTHRSQPFSALP